jgi:hypothetical protein
MVLTSKNVETGFKELTLNLRQRVDPPAGVTSLEKRGTLGFKRRGLGMNFKNKLI